LEAYLTDVDEIYPTLGHLKHSKPNTLKMRTPNADILERISKYQAKFNQSKFISSRQRTYDVAGGSLDVPLMLSGVPEHFSQIHYKHGKNVKIVFSPEVHVTSNPEALYMRGAAILSLISSLESTGNRVELWMGWDNTVSPDKYESRIQIKKTSQRLNVSSLANVMCDASFLCSCEFNMISHFLRNKSVGYNSGITLTGDITLTGAYDDMHHFDSETACLAWIDSIKAKLSSGQGSLQKGKN
jgi:hypothetical protein